MAHHRAILGLRGCEVQEGPPHCSHLVIHGTIIPASSLLTHPRLPPLVTLSPAGTRVPLLLRADVCRESGAVSAQRALGSGSPGVLRALGHRRQSQTRILLREIPPPLSWLRARAQPGDPGVGGKLPKQKGQGSGGRGVTAVSREQTNAHRVHGAALKSCRPAGGVMWPPWGSWVLVPWASHKAAGPS